MQFGISESTCKKGPNRDQLEFPSYFRKTKYESGRLHFPKPVYETRNIGHRDRMEFPNDPFNEYSDKLHFSIPESTYTKHPNRDLLEFPVLIRKHYLRMGPPTFLKNGVQHATSGSSEFPESPSQ